jgi:integrase
LRHTYATIALTNGEPAHIVSAALGHYDVAFTLSKYAAWIPLANVESMNRIGHHIFGTSTTENVTSGVT